MAKRIHTIFAVFTLRKSMRYIAVFAILIVSIFEAKAIKDPSTLFRACFNGSDSILTLEWTEPLDACGSFTEYHVYAQETGFSPILLGIEKTKSNTIFQTKLMDPFKDWSFYIETLNTCVGGDSLKSNTIVIDDNQPDSLGIDSVSVDIANNELVVGWQKSSSPDAKWYRVYEQISGSAKKIGDTVDLGYLLKQQSTSNIHSIRLAVFDSCNLPSPLSAIHQHMVLNQSVDTCNNTVNLSWNNYVGWQQIRNYEIYVKKNGGTYTLAGNSGTNNSFSYSDFVLGDHMCFYIRARREHPRRITSTSTEVCLQTRKKVAPSFFYINTTSVNGQTIDIEWSTDGSNDLKSLQLKKKVGSSFTNLNKAIFSGLSYTFNDVDVQVDQNLHEYLVEGLDVCDQALISSLVSNSIHLKLNKETLTWNSYINWLGSVQEYQVEYYDGSTWNFIASTNSTNYNLDTSFFNSSTCIRVRAIETGNPVKNAESLSNEVCTEGRFKFYVPNAINPFSENNVFQIKGTNIDYSQSTAIIFNRWGETLVKIDDLKTGWNGKVNNEVLPLGVYYYTMRVYGLNGEREERSGFLRIIR